MRSLKWLSIIAVLLVYSPFAHAESGGMKSEYAERVEVIASVNNASVLIGDLIHYELTVDAPKDSTIELMIAEQDEQWGGLVLREFNEQPAKPAGKNRERHKRYFMLESMVPGSYLIPSHHIVVTEPGAEPINISSQEIFVEVRSSLEDGKELELRGIKPPLRVERDLTFVYVIIALIALLLGFIIYVKKRMNFKKNPQATAQPKLPAHIIAMQELERIQSEDLIGQSKIKEYYYRVSNCIRFYIEGRFGIRAPESSTEEFIDEAIRSQKLEGRHINLLKEFLTACDLVKYSLSVSSAEQSDQVYRTAETFIKETQPEEVFVETPERMKA